MSSSVLHNASTVLVLVFPCHAGAPEFYDQWVKVRAPRSLQVRSFLRFFEAFRARPCPAGSAGARRRGRVGVSRVRGSKKGCLDIAFPISVRRKCRKVQSSCGVNVEDSRASNRAIRRPWRRWCERTSTRSSRIAGDPTVTTRRVLALLTSAANANVGADARFRRRTTFRFRRARALHGWSHRVSGATNG